MLCGYTSIPSYIFVALYLVKHMDNFIFSRNPMFAG
jgi:hypothetical protein